jgi:hypothetical protein
MFICKHLLYRLDNFYMKVILINSLIYLVQLWFKRWNSPKLWGFVHIYRHRTIFLYFLFRYGLFWQLKEVDTFFSFWNLWLKFFSLFFNGAIYIILLFEVKFLVHVFWAWIGTLILFQYDSFFFLFNDFAHMNKTFLPKFKVIVLMIKVLFKSLIFVVLNYLR